MADRKFNINLLSDSEIIELFSNAMEIARLGIWEWDLEEDKLYLSDDCFDITGFKKEDFDFSFEYILKNVIHDESRQLFIDSLNKAVTEGLMSNNVYKINSPIKNECWMKFNSRVVKLDDKIVKIIGVMMEVTDEVIFQNKLETELDFINSLIENLPNPFFYKDKEGLYKFFNKNFEEFVGFDRKDILNKTMYDIAPKELADRYFEADKKLLESGDVQVYESLVESGNGDLKNVIFRKSLHRDTSGTPIGILGLIEDISEKKKIQDEIKKIQSAKEVFNEVNKKLMTYDSEKAFLHDILTKFQSIYRNSDFAILLKVNRDGIISIYDSSGVQYVKEDMRMAFDKTYIHYIMKNNFNKVHIIDDIKVSDFPLDDPGLMIVEKNNIKSNVFVPVNIDAKLKWVFVFCSTIKNQYSQYESLSEYIRSEIDIMVRSYRVYKKTLILSRYDYMTGLMNRRYFEEKLEIEMEKENNDFFLVLIDMDGLKKVNDYLGHPKGDFYIRLLGNFLISEFENDCYFGRIGGDEFIGMVSGMTKNELMDKLEFIKSEYMEVMRKDTEEELILAFSYGISVNQLDGRSIKSLIKIADDRMYQNKKAKDVGS